jgi:hypothetical protein
MVDLCPDVTIAEVNRFAPYFLPVPHPIHTKCMNKSVALFLSSLPHIPIPQGHPQRHGRLLGPSAH